MTLLYVEQISKYIVNNTYHNFYGQRKELQIRKGKDRINSEYCNGIGEISVKSWFLIDRQPDMEISRDLCAFHTYIYFLVLPTE